MSAATAAPASRALIAAALRACADAIEVLDAPGNGALHLEPAPDTAAADLSVADAARELGIGKSTVRKLVRRRELASVRITGDLIRIPARSLDAFRRRHTLTK